MNGNFPKIPPEGASPLCLFSPLTERISRDELDRACMTRLAAGEDSLLDELMSRWQGPLVSFFIRFVGSREDALELAQETFLRLYLTRRNYRPIRPFSSYLFTIAANLGRNFLRWKERQSRGRSRWVLEYFPRRFAEDPRPAPDAQCRSKEKAQAVREAVLALPAELRLPLVLFEYEDFSYEEIAGILGLTPKAVECRLHRARRVLRKVLKPYLEGLV
jgi:RNA polymerase sigma-70 factor (ECF subfamily)